MAWIIKKGFSHPKWRWKLRDIANKVKKLIKITNTHAGSQGHSKAKLQLGGNSQSLREAPSNEECLPSATHSTDLTLLRGILRGFRLVFYKSYSISLPSESTVSLSSGSPVQRDVDKNIINDIVKGSTVSNIQKKSPWPYKGLSHYGWCQKQGSVPLWCSARSTRTPAYR